MFVHNIARVVALLFALVASVVTGGRVAFAMAMLLRSAVLPRAVRHA